MTHKWPAWEWTVSPSMMKPPVQKWGAGLPGRCLVGCFSRCSQRFVLVLRKLQIRKALGNERVARAYYIPAWRGATERSLQGWPCLANQIELEPGQGWLPLSVP